MALTSFEHADELIAGKYRILGQLGSGGTAKVHLAVALGPAGFSKLVVVKVPRPDLGLDTDLHDAFLREAQLAARLSHNNVVETFEVTEDGGLPVIIMEYLQGQPLSLVLATASRSGASTPGSRPFPLGLELRVIAEVLRGLHHVHELKDYDGTPLGLVHRDVAPHNVFVTYDGHVKLLDFGLAKLASSESRSQFVRGRLRYMSPEQLRCEPLDRRADIFSVGVMLWEALAGQRMWKGKSDDQIEAELRAGALPMPSSVASDVPRSLQSVCQRAVSPFPKDRPATALELEQLIVEAARDTVKIADPEELGAAVASMFEAERADSQRQLQQCLGDIALSERPQSLRVAAVADARPSSRTPQPPPTRRSAWARAPLRLTLAVGLSVALAAILWPLLRPSDSPMPVAPGRPAPLPTPPSSAPTVPQQRITLVLRATPNRARLSLDGVLLEGNPHTLTAPPDGSRHQVRAEAPGYRGSEAEVVYDRDRTVTLDLQKLSRQKMPVPLVPKPTASVPEKTPTFDCTEPSFIDHRGIKRYRPECFGK
jgi:serine/threonine-protein kinase